MKGFFRTMLICGIALVVAGLMPHAAISQTPGVKDNDSGEMARSLGMDPALCNGLQSQIDRITNIAQASASDEDKVSQLVEVLKDSLRNMRQSAQQDPEVNRIVQQYLSIIEGLLATAGNSLKADGKQISPEAKDELKKLTIMTGMYVSLVKIMCPQLKLPEAMNQ